MFDFKIITAKGIIDTINSQLRTVEKDLTGCIRTPFRYLRRAYTSMFAEKVIEASLVRFQPLVERIQSLSPEIESAIKLLTNDIEVLTKGFGKTELDNIEDAFAKFKKVNRPALGEILILLGDLDWTPLERAVDTIEGIGFVDLSDESM